jgi:hypothetical protein
MRPKTVKKTRTKQVISLSETLLFFISREPPTSRPLP